MTEPEWHASTDPGALYRHLLRAPLLERLTSWLPWGPAPAPKRITEPRLRSFLAAAAPHISLGDWDEYLKGSSLTLAELVPATMLTFRRTNPNLADLVRCAFGNPFREPAFRPEWRTETVVLLAEAIATEQAFDRLPVLADALEDAGCDDVDVLGHCRSGAAHAAGCWAVELALGRG